MKRLFGGALGCTMKNDLLDHALFQGKMVPKANFRTFVYSKKGDKRLANSWDEYQELVSSGIWSLEKPPEPVVKKKSKTDKDE